MNPHIQEPRLDGRGGGGTCGGNAVWPWGKLGVGEDQSRPESVAATDTHTHHGRKDDAEGRGKISMGLLPWYTLKPVLQVQVQIPDLFGRL
jgi:hypothetical protein